MKKRGVLLAIASILALVVVAGAVYCAADLADSVPIPSSIDATIPESPPDELHVVSYNVFLRPLPVSQPDYAAERAQQIGD